MAKYISTFITGFEEVIHKEIKKVLPRVKIIKIYNGLIFYEYKGNLDIQKIFFFNNRKFLYPIKNLFFDF